MTFFTNIELFFNQIITNQYPKWNPDVAMLWNTYEESIATGDNVVMRCKKILYKLYLDHSLLHYPKKSWQKWILKFPYFPLYVTYCLSEQICYDLYTPTELIYVANQHATLFIQYYQSSEWRVYDSIQHTINNKHDLQKQVDREYRW
jgi:hypothetical protein